MKFLPIAALLAMSLQAGAARAGVEEGIAAWKRHDYRTAARELGIMADHGNAQAQYYIGTMFRYGQGLTQDLGAARDWYRKAAVQNLAEAQRELAFLLLNAKPPQFKEGAEWLGRAAQAGDAESQFQLGSLHDNGLGVRADAGQRNAWWQKAAAQNYAPAQTALGEIYLSGDGVKADPGQAAQYFRAAARSGDAAAALQLARLLRDGRLGSADPVQAMAYFMLAASAARPGSQAEIAQRERDRHAAGLSAAQRQQAERQFQTLRGK